MKRATERSLADSVKMRTRGGQVDDVATTEAPLGETAAPKKKPRAVAQDAAVQLSNSARGAQPGQMKGPTLAPLTGTVDGLLAPTAASSQPLDPDVNAEGADLGGAMQGTLEKLVESKPSSKMGGAKPGKKKGPEPATRPPGEIHCHYCGTRESTYWRRGPDGPKTLCNSCGLNWFRQRPMQREQVEKDNLMAKAVAAAALKRPANSLKEGPEKRKREESKTGTKLREQLHGKAVGEKPRGEKSQPARKKQKADVVNPGEAVQNGAVAQGLKGLKRLEKGSSIRRKLGDAAVKKAALIKRTPSQLSLMGLLETAAAAPEKEPAAEVATSKLSGVLKGARFSPLKQAQTRLGAQKLLAVLNVIQKKKGFGRVTSTASLESVPEGASPGEDAELLPAGTSGEAAERQPNEAWFSPPDLDGSPAHDGANDGPHSDKKRTGARTQRRPNTALLQGASFLPWKARPRGWGENSSLTFAAAESRLLKAQAAANSQPIKGRPPFHKRSDGRPIDGEDGSSPTGVAGPGRKADPQTGRQGGKGTGISDTLDGLVGMDEDSDDDGFAGYGVLRKLLEKVDVPSTTSPPSKARPPLNRGQKPQGGGRKEPMESPPRARPTAGRPGLKAYESFEDLMMGTAGGMKRFESFEDLALRTGPVFARVESFEELALRAGAGLRRLESGDDQAGPGIRRFESFEDLAEDLAMRSEPVFEMPTLSAPKRPPGGDAAADVARGIPGSESESRDGPVRTRGREENQRSQRNWAVEDGQTSKRAKVRGGENRLIDRGQGIDGQTGSVHGGASSQSWDALNTRIAAELADARQQSPVERNGLATGRASERSSLQLETSDGAILRDVTLRPVSALEPGHSSQGQSERLPRTSQTVGADPGPQPLPNGAVLPPPGAALGANALSGDLTREGLASQVARLGPRGLSAMALHLLVDCAVDTEPPVDVKMLMQDLETLAIGNAMRGGVNGLLEGEPLGGTAGVNMLPEGSALGDLAGVNGLFEASVNGSALGERADVNGLLEGDPLREGVGVNGLLGEDALGDKANVNGLSEGDPLGERADMSGLPERPLAPRDSALMLGGVNGGLGENADGNQAEGGVVLALPEGDVSKQSGERLDERRESALEPGMEAPVSGSIPGELEREATAVAPPSATEPSPALGSATSVRKAADDSVPAVQTPQPSVAEPELHCAEELHAGEEPPSTFATPHEPALQSQPQTVPGEQTRTEANDSGSPRGVQPEQARPSDSQLRHGSTHSLP